MFFYSSLPSLSLKHHMFVCVLQLQELLKDFDLPVRVELETFEPAAEPDKTEVLFMSFDASAAEEDVPLPVEDLLDYIDSLNTSNMMVSDGVVHWVGRSRRKNQLNLFNSLFIEFRLILFCCILFSLTVCLSGPDLCASSRRTPCPLHSLCLNTLGSYTCVCQHGHYDVSSVMKRPAGSRPVCNGKLSCISHPMKHILTVYIDGLC